jgi:quercetin dioxygenase-like cupin family protein
MESVFKDYQDFVGSRPNKHYKATLFESEHLMLGLNCLEPGQEQRIHEHEDQDKFYFVLEGEGNFMVGSQQKTATFGMTIWAAAGVPHGVKNLSEDRLVILMGIAPAPIK